MYKKILVPLDGSPLSELALPHAEALAERFGSELVLLRVYQPASWTHEIYGDAPDSVEPHPQDFPAEIRHKIEQYLAHLQDKLLPSVKDRTRIETQLAGVAPDAIVDFAEQEQVDLIVMSTHGRSGLSRWVYGSVAAKVLQAAPCPVFLVRAAAAKK